jgi:hypothetical protein
MYYRLCLFFYQERYKRLTVDVGSESHKERIITDKTTACKYTNNERSFLQAPNQPINAKIIQS